MEQIKRDLYLNWLIERSGKSNLLFKLYYRYLVDSGVDPSRVLTVPLDDDDCQLLTTHYL